MAAGNSARRLRHLSLVLAATLVLVLALGLGLGLGLKHKHHSANTSVAPSQPSSALQSQPASNFILSNITGQTPQTRVFNFTIGTVQGAPDGFSRPMLAVNGTALSCFYAFFDANESL
jgi:hypothetical protein